MASHIRTMKYLLIFFVYFLIPLFFYYSVFQSFIIVNKNLICRHPLSSSSIKASSRKNTFNELSSTFRNMTLALLRVAENGPSYASRFSSLTQHPSHPLFSQTALNSYNEYATVILISIKRDVKRMCASVIYNISIS